METRTCPSCAAVNGPNDRFCGACGAPVDTSPDRSAGGERGSAVAGDRIAIQAQAPDVQCRRCGMDNPAARAFCQSCGTGLGSASATSVAAAGGAPGARSIDRTAAGPPARARADSGSAGSRRWVLVIAALGLLAGGLAVALPSLLGSRPATQADPTAPPSQEAPIAWNSATLAIGMAVREGG